MERSRRDREHLLGLNPIDDAIGGVSRLYDRYTVVIATHRPERIHDETRRWLAEHDIPYDRFVSDPGPEKTDVPADVLVDDSPSNVRGFARAGGHGVLFSQPWNEREEYGDGVTVVDGWSEVVRVCEDDTSVGPE
jgi:5'(3')-deoxyribonucleotidase